MMRIITFLVIFLIFLIVIPESSLIKIKRSLDSLKLSEIFIKGFYSFFNFFKNLTGLDLLAFFSKVFSSLRVNIEKEIFKPTK